MQEKSTFLHKENFGNVYSDSRAKKGISMADNGFDNGTHITTSPDCLWLPEKVSFYTAMESHSGRQNFD